MNGIEPKPVSTDTRPRWGFRRWLIPAFAPAPLALGAAIAICLIAVQLAVPVTLFNDVPGLNSSPILCSTSFIDFATDPGTAVANLSCLLNTGLTLAILAVFGTALCRFFAIRVATDRSPTLTEAWRFTKPRVHHVWMAPAILLTVAAIARIASWVMPLPFVAKSLVWTVATLASLSWPLMIACQAIEDSDCFDGLSRGIHFLLTQPLRFVAMLFTVLLVCPGTLIAGAAIMNATGIDRTLSALALLPIAAFANSAFFSWASLTFLHLRETIDATEPDEVYVPSTDALEPVPLSGRVAHPVADAA